MDDGIAIRTIDLWKRYGLPFATSVRGLAGLVKHGFRPPPMKPPRKEDKSFVLKGINLEVKKGEVFGIIGRNGAGKSTLLKLLAGVSPPTRGEVEIQGTVFPMIELNAGMNLDLSGRENVALLGAVMGISRSRLDSLLPKIEEFSELEEWFDKPVRIYSSGMRARLGFSVAMNVDTDVVLADEVLAVGDMPFQRKCFDRIDQLYRGGKTIVLVTHNLRQVELRCNRAALMDHGEIIALGTANQIVSLYYRQQSMPARSGDFDDDTAASGDIPPEVVAGTNEIAFKRLYFVSPDGTPLEALHRGDDITIAIDFNAHQRVQRPHFAISFRNRNENICACNTHAQSKREDIEPGAGTLYFRIRELPIFPGEYYLTVSAFHEDWLTLITTVCHIRKIAILPKSHHFQKKNVYGYFEINGDWRINQGG